MYRSASFALVFDVRGVRRFWLANHKYRWAMTGVYAAVMAMVTTTLSSTSSTWRSSPITVRRFANLNVLSCTVHPVNGAPVDDGLTE